MKLNYFFIIVLFATALAGCKKGQIVQPKEENKPVTNSFKGPSYADNYIPISSWVTREQWNLANVHDPSVEKCGDYYYMYQTDASYGNTLDGHGHFPYRRSKDLINWEFMGTVLDNPPTWVRDSLNNKRARMNPALPPIISPTYYYWAPYIKKFGNKYRLYYCVVVDNPIVGNDTNTSWSERAFIGLAECDDLATNVWTDKGMVICSEPDGVTSYLRNGGSDWNAYYKFNAIDPSCVITPSGDQWLIYGSWHSGIAAVKLDPATGKPNKLDKTEDYGIRVAGRGTVNTNRWQALEGAEIIYNEKTEYYYLFMAYDALSGPYNTRVARSKNVTGPYVGINGANVTAGAECWPMVTHPYAFDNAFGWVGFSHCSIFQNPVSKEWFYASQARLPPDIAGINVSNAVMMGHVRKISWTEDGWPVVDPERYAGVPKTTITEAALLGTWEQITMKYQYNVIQKSVKIALTADHKVIGGITGTWSYNNETEVLTVNGIKCNIVDAWDWEASPRKLTLTYSGYTSAGLPVWAKKVF